MVKKPRYLKKETLAKRILQACNDKNQLQHLDVDIGFLYDANKALAEVHQDRMKKLEELFYEFTSDPKSFVEKYAKMDDNQYVLEIIEKNPHWFKGLKWK